MNLELMALRWLLYELRCPIALRERSPRAALCGEPDVLGITKSRHLIEVEIKRSVSDFRADSRKESRVPGYRITREHLLPRLFYYLVPAELVDRVTPLVPGWAGLIRGPTESSYCLSVVKTAPANPHSRKLSIDESVKMVRMVANWAVAEAAAHDSDYERFRHGHSVWPEPEFEI